MEGDNKAFYQLVTTIPQPFELLPAEVLRFSVWYLVDSSNNPLHIKKVTRNLEAEVLEFGSGDEANEFLLYLRDLPGDRPLAVKNRTLLLREQPLRKSDLQGLQCGDTTVKLGKIRL